MSVPRFYLYGIQTNSPQRTAWYQPTAVEPVRTHFPRMLLVRVEDRLILPDGVRRSVWWGVSRKVMR